MSTDLNASSESLRVLWVDDDLDLTANLAGYLGGQGYEVDCASDLASAGLKLAQAPYDLVLVDLALPDGSGLTLIRDTPKSRAGEFVVMTGQGSVRTAVEALRHQVFDYLVKPVELAELRGMLARVKRAKPSDPARAAAEDGGNAASADDATASLVGRSEAIDQVRALVRRAAASDITVLIQGESGTGKEVVARTLHQLSARRNGPFVAMNCAAVSPSLIASELFGHEKGSFTGAHRQHKGIFERAEGGTLLLDEITEMPLDLQATLLRVLETGTAVRVGGSVEIPVNARVIAATNRNPQQYIEQGRFRLDLYYRLQVFPIELPALRERREDVIPLAEHFLRLSAGGGGVRHSLSPAALDAMMQHTWAGNIRELRNVVDRACVMSPSVIEPEHLLLGAGARIVTTEAQPVAAAVETAVASPGTKTLRGVENDVILQVLQACGGNRTRAASQLGISVKTLYNKLKRLEKGDSGPG